ncbi:unnamed protein product [Mytilus edulis]|uniref:Uncharacterized protein n=1 Tax=Mytilus edulis TaxID=6550 RepID=A0A8S3U451_MYTED|nr:unnamed protein product [Mytilus edulis]
MNLILPHKKPKILLLKHGNQLSSNILQCLLGHAVDKGYQNLTIEPVKILNQWTCPFAIVVLLSASGGHGSCRLNRYDFDVLEDVKENFKDFKDVTFVIKDSRHSVKYNSEDLNRLSEEIQFTLYGTYHPNNIYFNTFLFNDNQVSVRIGLPSSTSFFKSIYTINISKFEAEKAAKMICTDLNSKAQECQEKIRMFTSHLEDECANSRLHGLYIHELKIVAYRHEKVSGFGYIDGIVRVYITGSNEEDKRMCLLSLKREITYFAKLENGSRINKFKTAGTGPKGYGTLGMFLEDNNGTYFFTTCAHVIEEHAEAYFPDDNTKIGENVFVCHPNSNNNIKLAPKMDLSLIRVCPDFDIECKLGLKSVNGNFIKGAIFKGDISEIFGRRLYKWGATEPYLQTGKCTGIEEDEFIHIQINTDKFAKPGDSGAIICAGRDDETALAAFVLVGEEMTERKDKKTTYVVYKVADALEIVAHMTRAKKACLCTKTLTVCSASSSGSANRTEAKCSKINSFNGKE